MMDPSFFPAYELTQKLFELWLNIFWCCIEMLAYSFFINNFSRRILWTAVIWDGYSLSPPLDNMDSFKNFYRRNLKWAYRTRFIFREPLLNSFIQK